MDVVTIGATIALIQPMIDEAVQAAVVDASGLSVATAEEVFKLLNIDEESQK